MVIRVMTIKCNSFFPKIPVVLFCPGYAFLLFQEETSVQALIDACIEEDGKLYLCVSSPTIKDKPVSGRRSCGKVKKKSTFMSLRVHLIPGDHQSH